MEIRRSGRITPPPIIRSAREQWTSPATDAGDHRLGHGVRFGSRPGPWSYTAHMSPRRWCVHREKQPPPGRGEFPRAGHHQTKVVASLAGILPRSRRAMRTSLRAQGREAASAAKTGGCVLERQKYRCALAGLLTTRAFPEHEEFGQRAWRVSPSSQGTATANNGRGHSPSGMKSETKKGTLRIIASAR